MIEISLKQGTRLIIVTFEVLLLFVISYLALDSWLPPLGDKGFWSI